MIADSRISRRARVGRRPPDIFTLPSPRPRRCLRGGAVTTDVGVPSPWPARLLGARSCSSSPGRCLSGGRDRCVLQPAPRRARHSRPTACRAPNLLSFTAPDAPDVNLAWLFQIVLALAHRAGGIAGTVLLKTAFVVTTFAVLFRVALRRGAHPAAAAAALALAAWAASLLPSSARTSGVPRPRAHAVGPRARRGGPTARAVGARARGPDLGQRQLVLLPRAGRLAAVRARRSSASTDARPTRGARRSWPWLYRSCSRRRRGWAR